MISILSIPVTPIAQNARFVFNDKAEAILVDPGGDIARLEEIVEKYDLSVKYIVLTHAHLDHAGAVAASLERFVDSAGNKPQLLAYGAEAVLRGKVNEQAIFYGFPVDEYRDVPEPDLPLADNQQVEMIGLFFKVCFTPGHAPDHVSLFCAQLGFRQAEYQDSSTEPHWETRSEPFLLVGDALFQGSIGRTDLPGGSFEELERSIREKLYVLPEETRVLSGHGPDTSIGFEKANNAFVRPV